MSMLTIFSWQDYVCYNSIVYFFLSMWLDLWRCSNYFHHHFTAPEMVQTWCDFESPDLCGWTQDPHHNFDWSRRNFQTPSGNIGTGPSFDHTLGPGRGG